MQTEFIKLAVIFIVIMVMVLAKLKLQHARRGKLTDSNLSLFRYLHDSKDQTVSYFPP